MNLMFLKKMSIFGKEKLSKKDKGVMAVATLMSFALAVIYFYVCPPAYAVLDASKVAEVVKTVIKAICYIMGAFFFLLGAINWLIAHADGGGPEQKKAVTWMATGVLLVVLAATLVKSIDSSWFKMND